MIADGEWQRAELPPAPRPHLAARGFRMPWLPLASIAATIAAAATLVAGISDTLDDRSPGRLLPLQAVSPSPSPDSVSPAERLNGALVQLRTSVLQGVEAGDVRRDVGRDLAAAIQRILDRPRLALARRTADIARLRARIDACTRKGTIRNPRAVELHLILDRAA